MRKGDSDIIIERDRDLLGAYRKVAAMCWRQDEAWERAATSAAPRYYISRQRAVRVLYPMQQGDNSRIEACTGENSRAMYYSLWEKVKALSNTRAYRNKSFGEVVSAAIYEPAPSFFITARTVRLVYKKAKDAARRKRYGR